MTAIVLLTATLTLSQPQAVDVIPLWSGAVPHATTDTKSDKPSLAIYLAKTSQANAPAVVICPGGGYGFLADDHEGKQVAQFFNKHGIHAFVLQYRIVQKDRPGPLHPAPLADAQRAMRTVRMNASKYGVNPKQIGIMGFSAGGHLASTAGTHFDNGNPKAEDPIDRAGCRPDFMILAYPVISMKEGVTHGGSRRNLLGMTPDPKLVEYYSNETQVTKDTPPTFLFHTSADTAVIPENALLFYAALRQAKVPAELHMYEKGRHGVGLGTDPRWTGGETSIANWTDRLVEWLKAREILPAK